MATIRIHNLRLKTVIGVQPWERKTPQDVVINLTIEYDATKAIDGDNISHAFDYKRLTKRLIERVERSSFQLLEKLAGEILETAHGMGPPSHITVRVEKPGALRHADSVSVEVGHDYRP